MVYTKFIFFSFYDNSSRIKVLGPAVGHVANSKLVLLLHTNTCPAYYSIHFMLLSYLMHVCIVHVPTVPSTYVHTI